MRGDLRIADRWVEGEGEDLVSSDPGTGEPVAALREASPAQVVSAVESASGALAGWLTTPFEERVAVLSRYAEAVRDARETFARTLALETGKPLWEAASEVDLIAAKVPVSIEMHAARRAEERAEVGGAIARTHYRPIGVLAVLGPFNLPGHLPNGHIVPALLAGNTIVFKPSELTPAVGAELVALLEDAGVPPGVVNLVQGGREVGAALVAAPGVDGVLFTGSYRGGRALARALADRPEVQLALEMGGNNPLVVHDVSDPDAAVEHTLLSAYITAGQRCTCARRLIVAQGAPGDAFLSGLVEGIEALRVGLQLDEPAPFMGPLISASAADGVRAAEAELIRQGGRSLVALRTDDRSPALLHPGLVDVSEVADRRDEEVFGPLLQVVRVRDFDAAIEEANRTRYGLAAALLSDDAELFDRFRHEVRAGVVNWNRQTTGASGRLPFGGLGRSGNHRPAGAWAADYCSDPVATLESSRLESPASLPPGLGGDRT